jgi:GT2 family glycosyltransferase
MPESQKEGQMSGTESPLVSIIIVNTNEKGHLIKCLPAVMNQTYPNYEVVLVDNASSDGSVEYVEQDFPTVRIVRSPSNLGYAGANNLGFSVASGAYMAVLNPDTEADRHWLAELVSALERRPEAGLATSKILLMDEPAVINACGNVISVSGLTFCRGVGKPEWHYNAQETVPAVSGAAFLIRRAVLDEIGPFDGDFFIYLEEIDLSLRATLAGYKCLYVPTSKVYHKYTFKFSERKCFDIEKNRYYMLAKSFHTRTLVAMSPLLLLTELLVWGYMLSKGPRYAKQKLRSYLWLYRNRARIRSAHARTQMTRRVSDRVILQGLAPRFQFGQMVGGGTARVFNAITAPVLTGLMKLSLRLAA